MKSPEESTIRELVETLHYFTDLVRDNAIPYEREKELGTPYLKEYEKRYNEKVQGIAKEFNRKVPKYRKFRWDERHLIKIPFSE